MMRTMSAEDLPTEADELWARARQAEHAGDLKGGARELLKRAEWVFDEQWLKLFGLFLIHGLIGESAFDAAEDLALELSGDVRIEAQRIVTAARGASAGASEASRRVVAKRVLAALVDIGDADLDNHLQDFCELRQRSGDTVTGAEVLALRRRFRLATAARDARTPSAADLYSALTEIRKSAG